MVLMPARRTLADEVSRAAGKCLRLRCEKHFQTLPLSALSQIVSGGTPDTGEARYWDGDVAWLTPKDLGRPRPVVVTESERTLARAALSEGKARTVPKGTVLLSSRAPIGHLAIAGKDLATNQGFKNIVCSDQLHNRFLFHVLRGSIAELEALGRGNTFLEIPAKVVKDFRIPVPPLALQIEAANLLDAIYVRMAGHDVALPPVSEPLSGLIGTLERIEAIAGQIEEAKRLRGEAEDLVATLIASKVSQLFRDGAASGWQPSTLGDFVVDACYGTSEKTSTDSSGTPVLRMGNIQNGRIDTSDLKYLYLHDRERQRLLLESGDILVNRTNSAELVGKSAVFDLPGEYSFASYLIRLRVDRAVADPRLVAKYINSPLGRSYMLSEKRQMTGQANVNATKLKALPIALPGLQQQQKILAVLDAMSQSLLELANAQSYASTALQALLPAVLDQAFRGEM